MFMNTVEASLIKRKSAMYGNTPAVYLAYKNQDSRLMFHKNFDLNSPCKYKKQLWTRSGGFHSQYQTHLDRQTSVSNLALILQFLQLRSNRIESENTIYQMPNSLWTHLK